MEESVATLKDGKTVRIRPIRPDDDQTLIEGFRHLSPESVYQRFFTALPELSPGMARHLAHANQANRFALVGEVDSELAGVARYERTTDPSVVELGLVVVDAFQNRGLGRILLRAIVAVAERNGIHRFRADVLAENRRMLHLLSTEANIYERKTEAGVVTLSLTPLQFSPQVQR